MVTSLLPGCRVHALVVDDVAENREVLTQILQRVGVDVRVAKDGVQALESVEESMPDIVFMDIQMPGLPGDKIMQQIFEKYGRDQLKIVAVSASVLSHQHKSYLDAGFDDFIDKPVQLDRVYGCLADLLGVTFVYGDAMAEKEDVVMKEDLGEVVIDGAIWVALKEAAENHSITELRQHLAALEEMGDAERQMAQRLQPLIQRFDMARIVKVLEEIQRA